MNLNKLHLCVFGMPLCRQQRATQTAPLLSNTASRSFGRSKRIQQLLHVPAPQKNFKLV